MKALFNWSGGKDSALCLHKVLESGEYEVTSLLTTVSERYLRVSQHGVRMDLLERQAAHLGLDLHKAMIPEWPTMESYNELMRHTLLQFKERDVSLAIFGDIFLEDLRKYREEKLDEVGFTGVFPLWNIPTAELAREFISLGYKAVVVCVDEKVLDKSFAGREYDNALLNDLPPDVDPCGEYGEFHSFVYDGPIFSEPVSFTGGAVVYRKYRSRASSEADEKQSGPCAGTAVPDTGFWYCDLLQ